MEVTAKPVPGQQRYGETVFPYVMGATGFHSIEQAVDWTTHHRDDLLSLAATHGAVLIRRLIRDVAGFDAVVRSLGLDNFPYRKSLSNAVRINRTERVFSANEAPPEVRIYFHHEMAQTPLFPRWILFSCELAPSDGGATPLCRSDILYQRLQTECPDFAKACERKGLSYTNVMPGMDDAQSGMGRSWQSTLGVDNHQAAETRLRQLNYFWEWLEGDCLRATTPPLPAVVDLADGRKVFFNQLIAAFCGWKDERNDPSKAIRHGDGSMLDAVAVRRAAEIAEGIAYDLAWEVGDIAIVDNMLTMHARRPFVGKRSVVASLAEIRTQAFQPA